MPAILAPPGSIRGHGPLLQEENNHDYSTISYYFRPHGQHRAGG